MKQFRITRSRFGSGDVVTIAEMEDFTPQYEGWTTKIVDHVGELRVEAVRIEDSEVEYQTKPSRLDDWHMVTNDYGYLIIGHEVES